MDLFLLKKIATVLIMPINVVLLLLIIAVIFHWKKPKASIRCLIAATVILLLSSFPPISDRLMTQLEDDYPPFTKASVPIDYIVVLGCRHTSNPALPVTSQLGDCSLERMVEALRIFNLHPEARVITSGFGGKNKESNAQKVKQALVLLGVPAQKIITENFPKDTEEEAQLISPRIQGTEVVLVTNADHMPRAMGYFEAQGVSPIAAPTGYWVKDLDGDKNWGYYVPNSKKLEQTTIAWYESLGKLVQWFKSIF
ncbi:YdcF family protein [Colwellia sp. D2M02]|nr:YdcF family protein [Colwellia sp. D2M02]